MISPRLGIPAVIGTSKSIADEVATTLATRFYQSLGQGNGIDRAWREAEDEIKIRSGGGPSRDLVAFGADGAVDDTVSLDRFPWEIQYREGAEIVKTWNLPDAGDNPLFGLPEIPDSYVFPETPFRFLRRYEREHARLFFGRSVYIHSLYKKVNDPKGSPIVLLYGQSGVGKSSLLDAGLLPRLEKSHQVVYIRRDQDQGLLGTLQEALGVSQKKMHLKQLQDMVDSFDGDARTEIQSLIDKLGTSQTSDGPMSFTDEQLKEFRLAANLLSVWKTIEESTGKPLIIILDQVEEMYTRPMKQGHGATVFAKSGNGQDEWGTFLETLKDLFGDLQALPQGKLILAYRKEYHPEIDEGFKQHKLSRSTVFLEHLHPKDIKEVMTAYRDRPALRKAYNLDVDEELIDMITADLTADPDSPVAPALQIILSKLWQSAYAKNPEAPHMTTGDYIKLREEGIEMRDFFAQQMTQLKEYLPEAVDSGLALSVLHFHITHLGTAGSRRLEELREKYNHQETLIGKLVGKCQDLSLLNEMTGEDEKSILAHDTLAPVVQDEFNQSNKIGQRAARILMAKMGELNAVGEEEKNTILLDKEDLEVVEKGIGGMQILNVEEKGLIERSQERRRLRQRTRKRIQVAAIGMVALIIAGAVLSVILWRQAVEERIYSDEILGDLLGEELKDAISDLSHVRYSEALARFDVIPKVLLWEDVQPQWTKGMMELAFFYNESAHTDTTRLDTAYYLAKQLLEMDTNFVQIPRSEAGIQQVLQKINKPWYDSLQIRYFPVMITVGGGLVINEVEENGEYREDTLQVPAFQLAEAETTVYQYALFCADTKNYFYGSYSEKPELNIEDTRPGWGLEGNNPVVNVNWYDAASYTNWLTKRQYPDAKPVYNFLQPINDSNWAVATNEGPGYRLPNIMEWQFAAEMEPVPTGDPAMDDVGDKRWYDNNSGGRTHPVKQLIPLGNEELKIYDIGGNAAEWCATGEEYKYNPVGMVMGGCWQSSYGRTHSYSKLTPQRNEKDACYGFRVARSIE